MSKQLVIHLQFKRIWDEPGYPGDDTDPHNVETLPVGTSIMEGVCDAGGPHRFGHDVSERSSTTI